MSTSSFWRRLLRRDQNQTELLTQLLDEQRRTAAALEQLAAQVQKLSHTQSIRQTSTQMRLPKIASEQDLAKVPALTQFLAERGIAIKTLRTRQDYDAVHDEVALLLGSKYYSINPLLDNIKRTMQLGHTFNINISQYSQSSIADMTLIGRKLHDLAFLTMYHYQRAPRFLLAARPNTVPEVQNFFSGQWLERYILQVFRGIGQDVQALLGEAILNPQIVLPNGDDFELDLLATANGRVYWMECKTGSYQEHITKYSRFAQMLKLPVAQTIMVLPDAHESLTHNLSRMFGMHVVNLTELHDHLDRELSRP
ncbi:MAG: hypothetical protein ACK5GU_10030 [Chloroflexota bacterium]|jgi:hypothetical protein